MNSKKLKSSESLEQNPKAMIQVACTFRELSVKVVEEDD